MPTTLSDLLTASYHKSGIVAPDFETVTARQLYDGLQLLNDIINIINVNGDNIPYVSRIGTLTTVVGQESYVIPDYIKIKSLTYTLNTVRYYVNETDMTTYESSQRVNNINSYPTQYYLERTVGLDTQLYLYPKPAVEFELQIIGLRALASLDASEYNVDLALTYDGFFLTYLKYKLAQHLCIDYNIPVPAQLQLALTPLELKIKALVKPDLTIQSSRALRKQTVTSDNVPGPVIYGGWDP